MEGETNFNVVHPSVKLMTLTHSQSWFAFYSPALEGLIVCFLMLFSS